MKWTEVYIKTTEEASDAISEMLTASVAGVVVNRNQMRSGGR
jgi:hypothetical protein